MMAHRPQSGIGRGEAAANMQLPAPRRCRRDLQSGPHSIMTAIVAKYALAAAGLLLSASAVPAADITVMISGGYAEACKALVPQFEQATGNRVTNVYGPSMGETPQAIPNRIARGEPVDVVIGVGYAVDKLAEDGKLVHGSGSIWRKF
jgi:molybdate transport system substrate-binding protein